MRHLLRRSWESLPAEHRIRRAIDLLEAPIAGLDGPTPLAGYNWPDPAEVLTGEKVILERTPGNEQQWQAAVDVVARGLIAGTVPRNRASIRMAHLVESRQLRKPERTGSRMHCGTNSTLNGINYLASRIFYDWGVPSASGTEPRNGRRTLPQQVAFRRFGDQTTTVHSRSVKTQAMDSVGTRTTWKANCGRSEMQYAACVRKDSNWHCPQLRGNISANW